MTLDIIGCAAIGPGAENLSDMRRILRDGLCTVREIPPERWALSRWWHPKPGILGKTYTFAAGVVDNLNAFDPGPFGLSTREAMQMDPQQRLLLQTAFRALEDAALPPSSLQGERVGVYVGGSALDQASLASEDSAAGGPYFMTGNTLSILSNRLSHVFGFTGPSFTVDTACSSSLFALDLAAKALWSGDIDTALVGGVSVLAHPLSYVGFAQAHMLSPEGLCRAFDNNASGYVRAEGCVVLVLRRTDRARQNQDRARARVHACAVNASGRTGFISLPSVEAQTALLNTVYHDTGLDVDRLVYMEAHGTGTKAGDPIEATAIGEAIGKHRKTPLPLGSIKTNIGHTEPASGLFGVIKAIIALEDNVLPASLHFDTPNEDIDFDALNIRVVSKATPLPPSTGPRFIGVNSFGFGGANAHVVLSDPDRDTRCPPAHPSDALTFVATAHTPTALSSLLSAYENHLEGATAPNDSARIIAAAGGNRDLMRHRFVVRAPDEKGVLDAIKAQIRGRVSQGEIGEALENAPKTAFVFAGNGAHWAGMGRAAYLENDRFRQAFQMFSSLFEPHLTENLVDLLDPGVLEPRLGETRIAQPFLFTIQAALCDVLASYGVRPDVVFGHSVGEVAAAYIAGNLSASEAVLVIARRSLHQEKLAGAGKMAAVSLGETDALAFAQANGFENVCVGSVNGPSSVTITGPTDEIQAYRDLARKAKIPVHVLDINYPFHHPMIDRQKDAFLAELLEIYPKSGTCPFVSTVTGDVLDGRALDPAYWWQNVRDQVLFQKGCETALSLGCSVFMEISPRPILGGYLSQIFQHKKANGVALASLVREAHVPGLDPVSKTLARLLACGVLAQEKSGRDAFVAIPALPLEPTVLKMPETTDSVDLFGRNKKTPYTLLGWRVDPNGTHWKNHLDARLFPDIAQHVVEGKAILPGSAFLDIAIAAARELYGTDAVEIGNMDIVRPLDLREDRLTELSTLVSRETGLIEIRSRELLGQDDFSLHAVARARTGERPHPCQETDPEFPPETTLDAARIYETADQFGLSYGPAFRLATTACVFGHTLINVTLAPPAPPAHPHLSHVLNPFSVDAAFHGLVALFGQFSGTSSGAPYIPVHFGSVRTFPVSGPITRARITLGRVSPSSLKARIVLVSDTGETAAILENCRFRRTFLKRPKTLETLAFHFEATPSTFLPSPPPPAMPLSALVPQEDPLPPNTTTLLLDAAIYRAAWDLLTAVSKKDAPAFSLDRLSAPPRLKTFLETCLYLLEDIGVAEFQEPQGWRLAPDISLPPVEDTLGDVYREDPSRMVEGILINDVYRQTLGHLEKQTQDTIAVHVGEATVQHVLTHAPLGRRRLSLVLDATRTLLETSDATHLVELGSTSVDFSRRLAVLCDRVGAALTIVDPRDTPRRLLELSLGGFPCVKVVATPDPDTTGTVDLMLATGPQALALLAENGPVRRLAQTCSRLFLAGRAPSVFNDFAFGLKEDDTLDGTFDSKTVSQTLATLGFAQVETQEITFPEGALTLALASLPPAAQGTTDARKARPVFVVTEAMTGPTPALGGDARLFRGLPAARAALVQDVTKSMGDEPRILYVADGPGEPSALMLDRLDFFRDLGAALQGRPEDKGAQPVVAILAPNGAPVSPGPNTSPANTALWTFARVFQNEVEAVDIHLIDADPDAPRLADFLDALFCTRPKNREWRLDSQTNRLEEIRVSTGPAPLIGRLRDDIKVARLRQDSNVRFDDLIWEEAPLPSPGPDDVIVETAATALNFRDVMWVMGLLPEEALEDGFAGAGVGMEFSGVVAAAGANVTDLAIGDRVMGIGPEAFATHVKVRQDGVANLPDTVPLTAAATLPVAFLTAWYALSELARLKDGETVLIHGAAGGVGLAAVQICKLKGARIIATAGTPEKRDFLVLLGVDHVLDSRSLSFYDQVLELTNGEGVDVVLNSLFAEAMERSFELTKPFGRFLELGKRDYYADRKLALRPFRRNVSYFGIDADQLPLNEPALTRRLFAELGALFASGALYPLPYREFDPADVADAFRLMQQSGHIGKILVCPAAPGTPLVHPLPAPDLRFDPNGIYLVVGGVGGFGFEAVLWLAAHGARRIAVCSRRGVFDGNTAERLKRLTDQGVVVSAHPCDVTNEAATTALLDTLRAKKPLKGVIHAAMVLDDALLSNLTQDRNRPVLDVKIRGADILDRLTRTDALDLFLLFSSVTTMIGNPGQSNYVAANGFLEGLARRRRALGLPALAVGFGAIGDAGFLARDGKMNDIVSKRLGKTALRAQEALDQVSACLRLAEPGCGDGVVVVADVDWSAVRRLTIAQGALLEAPLRSGSSTSGGGDSEKIDLESLIREKSREDAEAILFDLLRAEVAAVLRVAEETVSGNASLKNIGLDSLMAMELVMSFEQKTGVEIPLLTADTTTLWDLVRRLHQRLLNQTDGQDAPLAKENRLAERLIQAHGGGDRTTA